MTEFGRFAARVAVALGLIAGIVGAAMAQDDPHPGQAVFEQHCTTCHQSDGQGIPPTFPALAGNDFVTSEPAAVVRKPLEGPGAMPSFAGTLTDQQIADVLSYVRSTWGNDAPPVSAELVAEVRAEIGADPAPAAEDDASDGDSDKEAFAWQELGADVFARNCAACHQADGGGIEGIYPALAGNPFVQSGAEDVARVPLNGRAGMPSFGGELSNEELAAVVSYIRNSWDNEASVVTPNQVAQLRSGADGDEEEEEEPRDPRERPGAAN
ncbi:MAG: c-type cytochrome [Trueperaceae bacterium]|nr:c-type cytochrome [Trueperaceae bacterium]